MISPQTIKSAQRNIRNALYGGFAQDIRIEWITNVGGAVDVDFAFTSSGVDTENVSNVKGILSSLKGEAIRNEDTSILYQKDGVWLIDTDVDLKVKEDFIIVQFMKDEYYNGTGTGSGSVFTDDDATMVIDVWKNKWLVFSDRRFLITANTGTAITVELNGGSLPASDDYEIMAIKIWRPVDTSFDLGDSMGEALGDGQILQQIYSKQVPIRGA